MFLLFIQKIMTSTQSVLSILVGFGVTLLYFFIRKEAKTSAENTQLKEGIKAQNEVTKKLVNVQRKQAEISAQSTPDRDAIHDGLCEPDERDDSKP